MNFLLTIEPLAKVFFIMSFRQDFSRNPGKSSYGFPIKHFGNDKWGDLQEPLLFITTEALQ